jgi:hypothetical protein
LARPQAAPDFAAKILSQSLVKTRRAITKAAKLRATLRNFEVKIPPPSPTPITREIP